MPEVKPFSAIRFNPARTAGDLSTRLAPPYDVLGQPDKDGMLAKDSCNIVAIDLPHIPPNAAGPEEAYRRSAALLQEWLEDGILIQDQQTAYYLYHQLFEYDGKKHTRQMFIARVRLEPFSQGSILPHERTFGGPKEDRLALMKATRCQLSAIFGLYVDPEDRIRQAFSFSSSAAPDVSGSLDGIENRMWIVSDADVVDSVTSVMADKKIYIADGHHRYGTALLYRDWLAKQEGSPLSSNHPANYVMFVLASMNDPGCLILPYHRVLANIEIDALLDAWSVGTGPATTHDADMTLYDGRTGREAPLRFTHRAVLAELEPRQCEAWHRLDYAYLHRYLIDDQLRDGTSYRLQEVEPIVHYVKSADDAKRTARNSNGVALLMNATPMAHLRAVSEAGGLMPQKSTYFYPKLATGLTLNALARTG